MASLAGMARAQDAPDAASDTTLITAADIERENAPALLDLLRSRVGLDVNNSVITMRGVSGIAVFVDGFASSSSELSRLRPQQVERIEIFRGAASARFGADAMGGAILITTRNASAMHASLTQGLDDRLGHFTRLGGSVETGGFGASMLVEDAVSRGFRTVPDSPFPYQITVADERGRSQLFDGKLSWRGEPISASVNFKRNDVWSFFGRPNWWFDWRTDNLRGQLDWRPSATLGFELAAGEERYSTIGLRDQGTGTDEAGLAPAYRMRNAYRQREGTLAATFSGAGWKLRAGANSVELSESFGNADAATGVEVYSADSLIRKLAFFVAGDAPLAAGRLDFGLRRDLQRYVSSRVHDAGPPAQDSVGGGAVKSATSPKIALSWPLPEGFQLRGSFGTGFSPPQASQLYNGFVSEGNVTLPNPALAPETSRTFDLGLRSSGAWGDWALTLFATHWSDKIATRILSYGLPNVTQPQNVGAVRAHGVEVNAAWRLHERWSLSANYTYNRTRVVQSDADPELLGKELPDQPRNKANLTAVFEGDGAVSARAKLRLIGPAFTDDANTQVDAAGYHWRKAGYAVLDLGASWQRSPWQVSLALDNALGRDYVTGFFWHGEPRTLRLELTLNL